MTRPSKFDPLRAVPQSGPLWGTSVPSARDLGHKIETTNLYHIYIYIWTKFSLFNSNVRSQCYPLGTCAAHETQNARSGVRTRAAGGSLQSTPTARANAKRSPAAACLSMANSRGALSRRGKTHGCTCAQVRGERRGSQRAWARSRAKGQVCSEVSMRARTGDHTNSVCRLQRSLAHAARQN